MPLEQAAVDALERQAARIDRLERYLVACRRKGITDDLALETYRIDTRAYRRSLADLGPDGLFEYAALVAGNRQN